MSARTAPRGVSIQQKVVLDVGTGVNSLLAELALRAAATRTTTVPSAALRCRPSLGGAGVSSRVPHASALQAPDPRRRRARGGARRAAVSAGRFTGCRRVHALGARRRRRGVWCQRAPASAQVMGWKNKEGRSETGVTSLGAQKALHMGAV